VSRPKLARWALALLLPVARPAAADCTSAPPHVFEPAPGAKPAKFTTGYTNGIDLYRLSSGERRLLVMENYGYAVFSLANPAAPAIVSYHDMSSTVPQQGDGQSIIISLGAAEDGSRALVNWKQSPYGTFLMKANNRSTFDFAGNFPSFRSSAGVVADLFPSRAIAYALNTYALYMADVTNFVSGPDAIKANSIVSDVVPGATVSPSVNHLTRAGHFLVYATTGGVVVVDARTPGPIASLPVGLHVTQVPNATFGLGPADSIVNVSAALHPITGALFVAAEGSSPTKNTSTGIGLVSSPTTSTLSFQKAGPVFQLPSSWGTTFVTSASTMVATATDLLAFHWESTKNGFKLVTLSTTRWGEDLTPDLAIDPAQVPEFAMGQALRGFASGTSVYLYVAAQQGGIAVPLTCAPVYPIGDVDGDGQVAVSDVFALINFLVAGGESPVGPADANRDGAVDVADVFALVNYLFSGTPLP
jgi:hypothetical protein